MTLLAFWKPFGVVSRFTPEGGHACLADFIPARDVYPIGRLDADSEGLLLLGDDGELAHALTDPQHAHPRSYWVQVEGEPDAEALASLARGVVVQGRRTLPAQARAAGRRTGAAAARGADSRPQGDSRPRGSS